MRRALVTQRVDVVHGERRDALDQAWTSLLARLRFAAVPVPNLAAEPERWVDDADAVVFSGGNDVGLAGTGTADAPERDATESAVYRRARELDRPVFAVCRGLQNVNVLEGGSLRPVERHVGGRHQVVPAGQAPGWFGPARAVNSYHRWGIPAASLAPTLSALALDEQGNVEAAWLPERPVVGVMWHPERERPTAREDLALMARVLEGHA